MTRDNETIPADPQAQRRDIDPRVLSVAAGRPPHERFIIIGMAYAMPPDMLNVALNESNPGGPDFTEVVADRPLHWWLGKSREQIQRETSDTEKTDAVVAAMEKRGMQVTAQPVGRDQAEITEDRQRAPVTLPRRPEPARPEDERPAPGPTTTEPTFGNDQIPFSELRGLSDEELRANEGIGDAAILEIRRLEGEALRRDMDAANGPQAQADRNEAIRRAAGSASGIGRPTGPTRSAGGAAGAAPAGTGGTAATATGPAGGATGTGEQQP